MNKAVARILIVVFVILITLGALIFIPVSESMTVPSVQWRTVIKCYTYTQHHEDSWGTTSKDAGGLDSSDMRETIPYNAYNIRAEYEYHHTRHTKVGKVMMSHKVYKWHYYYDVDKWDQTSEIANTGDDKNPVEGECDLPCDVSDPVLGDMKRETGHSTLYFALCEVDGKEKAYDIDELTFTDLMVGDQITCKRYRFGSSIFDVKIGG